MNKNKYVKTDWKDHIVDTEQKGEDGKPLVIQEGTRFTAARANNIEEGVYNAHEGLLSTENELVRLRIQLEMLGRAPSNNGTFFDPLEDEGTAKSLELLKDIAVSQTALNVGSTEITVEKIEGFKTGEEITIFDEENSESKVIENITSNKITVSALEKASKKGALVVKSNTVLRGNKLTYYTWGNYEVRIKELI